MGNISDGTGSSGAFTVWPMGNTEQCCPIARSAHKTKRVIRSSLAAETLSLQEGPDTGYYYREILVGEYFGP